MSGIKGHPNQKRFSHESSAERFVSVLATDPKNRAGLDVLPKAMYPVDVLVKTAETLDLNTAIADPKLKIVKLTGADATIRKGDIIRFNTGTNKGMELPVEKVETDYIYLAGELLSDPDGEDFFHMRHITLTIDESGALSVSNGPIQFIRNGSSQQVIEDTVDSANNVPLPVKLTDVTGDINITAGDLNIQSTHTGANPDSIQIGDGTEILQINAGGEATVHDQDTHDKLDALNAKFGAIGQKASAASAPVVLSTEQEALINDLKTLLTSLDGVDFATQTTLATLAAEDFATEATLAALQVLLTSIRDKDFATEATLNSLLGKFNSLGQKANAGSAPVTLSSEQETLLTDMEASLDTIASGAGNLSVVDQLDSVLIDATTIPASSAGYLTVVASLASNVKKIKAVEDANAFVGLYDGLNNLLCVLPQGFTGGEIEIDIPAGTVLKLRNLKDEAIAAGNMAINFLG